MAIIKDKKTEEMLRKTVGKRLRSARIAAEISLEEASEVIGHRGITQLPLAENGERLMPLVSTFLLAQHYGVSIDYPVSDAVETSQGAFVAALKHQMVGMAEHLATSMALSALLQIEAQRDDRRDLQRLVERVRTVTDRFKRFRELNSEFDEDMRGSASLTVAVETMAKAGVEDIDTRLKREDKMR